MVKMVVMKDERDIEFAQVFDNIKLAYQYYLSHFITNKELKHIKKYHLETTTDIDLIKVLFKHCFTNACILDEMFI